jgi:hypothetical protein
MELLHQVVPAVQELVPQLQVQVSQELAAVAVVLEAINPAELQVQAVVRLEQAQQVVDHQMVQQTQAAAVAAAVVMVDQQH